jgi:hypothetical protein
MNDLDFRMNDLGCVHSLNKIKDLIEAGIDVPGVIPNHTEAELSPLPEIIVANL